MTATFKKNTIVVSTVIVLAVSAFLYMYSVSTRNNFSGHPLQPAHPAVTSSSPESADGDPPGFPVTDAVSAPVPTLEYIGKPEVIHFGTATPSEEDIQEEREWRERMDEVARPFDLTTVEGYRQWLVEMSALEESGVDVQPPNKSLSLRNPDITIDPDILEEMNRLTEEVRNAQLAAAGIEPAKRYTFAERLELFDSLAYEEQEREVNIWSSGALGVAFMIGPNDPAKGTINGVSYERTSIQFDPVTIKLSNGNEITSLGVVIKTSIFPK